MKIYFAGSIRGGRDDSALYFSIIELLKEYGEVLTEHIGDKTLGSKGQDKTAEEIFLTDTTWISEADIIVAEVTQPSLGVGYEIGRAEALNKKIICLYRPSDEKRLSAMIGGNGNILKVHYQSVDELKKIFDHHLIF